MPDQNPTPVTHTMELNAEEWGAVLALRSAAERARLLPISGVRVQAFKEQLNDALLLLKLQMLDDLLAEGTVLQEHLQDLVGLVLNLHESRGHLSVPAYITKEKYPHLHKALTTSWQVTTPCTPGHPVNCSCPNCR